MGQGEALFAKLPDQLFGLLSWENPTVILRDENPTSDA